MLFLKQENQKITSHDAELYSSVCIMIRYITFIYGEMCTTNSFWKLPIVDCHTMARLTSLLGSELELVDGTLLGLTSVKENGSVELASTLHSWCVLLTEQSLILTQWELQQRTRRY